MLVFISGIKIYPSSTVACTLKKALRGYLYDFEIEEPFKFYRNE